MPTMTASEWFSGKDKGAKIISLQPEGMECRKIFFLFYSFMFNMEFTIFTL